VSQLVELLTATEAVGNHDGGWPRGLNGREQVLVGDGLRHLELVVFETEGAGHAAATGLDQFDCGARHRAPLLINHPQLEETAHYKTNKGTNGNQRILPHIIPHKQVQPRHSPAFVVTISLPPWAARKEAAPFCSDQASGNRGADTKAAASR